MIFHVAFVDYLTELICTYQSTFTLFTASVSSMISLSETDSLILSLCSRLFGSCAALHSDKNGRGLDFPGSSGTDYGSS